ncbi:hypothetical protein F511_27303 [Dorcoceras hygrometricum]|uniref:Dystroglycan-like n=1 Tax=Dorcoceras hygrometricum TaxID=472368 RepID=A0A2Z7BR90_9LAMI|nr:hypothetical protein F511_27303 [Dorcoceras hygrometricum]
MASSFITYALQVNFESVLGISDNEGMLNMFKALEASGIRGFLGCPSVFYEKELEQFFDTTLVQDGDITGAVSGKFFTTSETRFAEVLKLPTEGLVVLSEMPKNLEMVDKTLKKAKGFAAQICVLLKSNPVITMGEAVPFPSLKILSIKTVNSYVVMNETIDARGKSDEPGMAKVAVVKRKTETKKKSESNEEATGETPVEFVSEKVVSKKRPTVVGDEADITKKKRTTKSKASSSKVRMDIVSIAQDAVPLQIIRPTLVATAEQPPVPKRKSKKSRLVLSSVSNDENVEKRVAVENIENIEKSVTVEVTVEEYVVEPTEEERHASAQVETTDDVDVIVEKVIAETSQLVTDEADQLFGDTDVGEIVFGDTPVDKADDLEQWFDRSYEDFVSRDAEKLIVSTSELNKGTIAESEGSKDVVVAKAIVKSVSSYQNDEEQMSLDDLLMQISDDMMLLSVTADEITKIKSDLPVEMKEVNDQDWYYASLPKISATKKGKAPLEEADTVKGNPSREMVQLICADVDFLVQMLQQAQEQAHGIIMDRPSSSQPFDYSAASSGAVLAQFYSLAKYTCWVRPMVLVDGIWTPLQGNDYWRSSCRLSIFVNRKRVPERVIEENFVPHCYFIEPVQYWGAAPSIIKSWGWFRVCTEVIRYSMFGFLRPVRGENLCRDIVVHSSVVDILEKIPDKFCSVFQQGLETNSFVDYFSDSSVQPVLQNVPNIESLSSDGDSDEQTSDHQFDLPVSTTIVGSTPAVAQLSIPATDITESFAQLRASIEDILFEQIRCKDDTDRLRDVLLMHLRDLEKRSTERFDQLDRAYRTFLNNSRKDSQDLRAVLSLDLSTSQKKLSTQFAATALDNVDIRKEVKALNAKLGLLVDYINRGGDAKKGESGSSQPRPPPDDQSRPSGGGGDSASQRRSGSSQKRRSIGESPVRAIRYGPYPPGGPPKRSAKYCVTGEKDF